ncbi:MAG: hypothetical protein Q8Q60_00955 [Candidatus Chromulinivorax sp.]|nr:hypothetical protein [Candidatus Chromulinivorax sp.]
MIVKNNLLFYVIVFACLPSVLSANLTTLQSWDPIPFFNAANLNMPSDTPFVYNLKNRILDDTIDKHRRWGINISPFVQKATRAQQTDNIFFGNSPTDGVSSPGVPGFQMSDYQGTPYLMGLFLGSDSNGNSIWGSPGTDTGITTDITTATVSATALNTNLKTAINALNDNANAVVGPPAVPGGEAIIYNSGTVPDASATTYTYTAPSILSQGVLDSDSIYFGAFSVPLTYQKAGFRWELNFDCSDNVGFIARGGFCQITQRAGPAVALSSLDPNQTISSTDSGSAGIYYALNTVENANLTAPSSLPLSFAQNTFDEWVTNNIDDLLDAEDGADYNIQTFSQAGLEDIQLLAFVRHTFTLHPVNKKKHATIMLTPYIMFGGTAPIAPVRDYSKLYALPFGNNSHPSIGGVAGVTFDFMKSIEFGFEFGATAFLPKNIDSLPMPNHMLQRVIYPYRQDVKYSPGCNGQFSAILNAYKFTHNVSFSLRYNYVQHNQDTITLITSNNYFIPSQLEEQSMWNSQMFIGALMFELQPSVYMSIAWQGALSQKNAYCSNTILGSLNFLF